MLTRANKAGAEMGRAIIEMAHLFYQNNTANHFYHGLMDVLWKEFARRNPPHRKKYTPWRKISGKENK